MPADNQNKSFKHANCITMQSNISQNNYLELSECDEISILKI